MYYNDSGLGALAVLIAFLIALPFIAIFYVLISLFYMKVFEKAGVEGKWRAWVPVYNTLIFAKLGELNPWWLLILWGGGIVLSWVPVLGWLISIAAYVYLVLAAFRVGQKLQKDGAWIVLYIFLPIVWLGIAGFDRSRWNTAIPAAPWANSFLRDSTVWGGVPAQAAGGYAAPGGYQAPGGYAPPQPPAATEPPAAPPAPPTTPPTQPPVAPDDPESPDAPRA